MTMESSTYPVTFSVEYPERSLDRVTTFFRIFTVIPIMIVLSAVSGSSWRFTTDRVDVSGSTNSLLVVAGAGGLLFFGPLLMILFRQKYPRWWFDWNLELQRFSNRVGVYLALMDDRYPSTDDHQAVHLEYPYPDVERDLNRWLPLVKWLLALPHYIVLLFLSMAAVVAVIIAWFAILFTGTYPRGLFDFVEGVFRWSNRVTAYAFTLVTDEYPPFRLPP
jgi:hypothetical protein